MVKASDQGLRDTEGCCVAFEANNEHATVFDFGVLAVKLDLVRHRIVVLEFGNDVVMEMLATSPAAVIAAAPRSSHAASGAMPAPPHCSPREWCGPA
jgi:hypothetical protein